MQQCLISASFGIWSGRVINPARRLASSCECTCICLHLFRFQLSFLSFFNRPRVSVLISGSIALPNENFLPSTHDLLLKAWHCIQSFLQPQRHFVVHHRSNVSHIIWMLCLYATFDTEVYCCQSEAISQYKLQL